MTEPNYPLHPNQTTIQPFYVQIPMELYEQEKAELNAYRESALPRLEDSIKIRELKKENDLLKELNSNLQSKIFELEDKLRARNEKLRKLRNKNYETISTMR